MALKEDNGEAVVIISEPPPVFTRDQYRTLLTAIFGEDLLDFTYCRWPTGLDGYLEDIVLRLRVKDASRIRFVSASDLSMKEGSASIVDRLRMLYELEYGTSDGFSIEPAEVSNSVQEPIPELKVPIHDLVGWVLANKGQWSSLKDEDSPPVSISQLYKAANPGSFVDKSGIVVLVAPKRCKLADLRAPFRRFAVASDLVIGAVGTKTGNMLLFARARSIPISQLPPLRFESFESFARNRAGDIAQSYERQRIFAGRIQTGQYAGWDWAPILLSSQLDDTEFGTLLNFADQILKSWSQHGSVEYYAFPYPKPDAFPFGNQAASDYFQSKFHTTSLLFNWNTDEFSSIARVGEQDVLTASRTGALRILYRPSDSPGDHSENPDSVDPGVQTEADQKAKESQDYFAGRANPILIRVVQNVMLYQAEQNFLTVADPQDGARQSRSDRVEAVLEQQAAKWLAAASQHKAVGTEDSLVVNLVDLELRKSGLTPAEMARLIASPQKVMIEFERARQRVAKSALDFKALEKQADEASILGEASFRKACGEVGGTLQDAKGELKCDYQHLASAPRTQAFAESEAFKTQIHELETAMKDAKNQYLQSVQDAYLLQDKYARASKVGKILTEFSGGADLDFVLSNAIRAGAVTTDSGFIRTPSVVLSKNVIDADAVGGHNIDLVPRRFIADIKVSGIELPLSAKPALKTIPVRKITEQPEQVERVLGTPRTGSLLSEMRPRATSDPAAFADVLARAKTCNCDAIISQTDDGTILFVRNEPPPVRQIILGKTGVIDAMTGPPILGEVHFENFDRGSVENLARTQSLLNGDHRSFDQQVDGLKQMFSPDGRRNGGGAEILIAREGREPESLTLIGAYDEHVSLREHVSWRGAQVNEAVDSEWNATFGAEPKADLPPYSRLIVRFGQTSERAGALGVSAESAGGSKGFADSLKAVVNQWLGRQLVRPSTPMSESLLDLRAAIMTKLKPVQLKFYLKRNGGQIQAAQADFNSVREISGF